MTFNCNSSSSNSKSNISVDAVLGDTNAVFPYNQNVSSNAIIQIRQLFQQLLDNIDRDFFKYFALCGDSATSTLLLIITKAT